MTGEQITQQVIAVVALLQQAVGSVIEGAAGHAAEGVKVALHGQASVDAAREAAVTVAGGDLAVDGVGGVVGNADDIAIGVVAGAGGKALIDDGSTGGGDKVSARIGAEADLALLVIERVAVIALAVNQTGATGCVDVGYRVNPCATACSRTGAGGIFWVVLLKSGGY